MVAVCARRVGRFWTREVGNVGRRVEDSEIASGLLRLRCSAFLVEVFWQRSFECYMVVTCQLSVGLVFLWFGSR